MNEYTHHDLTYHVAQAKREAAEARCAELERLLRAIQTTGIWVDIEGRMKWSIPPKVYEDVRTFLIDAETPALEDDHG